MLLLVTSFPCSSGNMLQTHSWGVAPTTEGWTDGHLQFYFFRKRAFVVANVYSWLKKMVTITDKQKEKKRENNISYSRSSEFCDRSFFPFAWIRKIKPTLYKLSKTCVWLRKISFLTYGTEKHTQKWKNKNIWKM